MTDPEAAVEPLRPIRARDGLLAYLAWSVRQEFATRITDTGRIETAVPAVGLGKGRLGVRQRRFPAERRFCAVGLQAHHGQVAGGEGGFGGVSGGASAGAGFAGGEQGEERQSLDGAPRAGVAGWLSCGGFGGAVGREFVRPGGG